MADPPIYLDNHSTTRTDPRVVEAMLPWLTEQYGNASSTTNAPGLAARDAVESARATVARAIGADPGEIVFTSGATESNNLALAGVAERPRRRGDLFLSVRTEHRAVLGPLERLARRGLRVKLLDVAPHGEREAGRLDPQRLADAIDENSCLASVMLANNEIGVVQPVAAIGAICKQRGVLLHCDAAQALGRLPIDVAELGVDLLSMSAHKLYGPKGVGALYVRKRDPVVRLEPQLVGGGQEAGRRSGTINVAGVVGFAKAVELAETERAAGEPARLAALRDRLADGLLKRIAGAELCGPALDALGDDGAPLRLPGNLMVALGDVAGETVMLRTPGLALSSGSACSSADPEPSHVLRALGLDDDRARSALRFGWGRFNRPEEADIAAERVAEAVTELRRGL
ncbi:cysteine desulfurase family protein [Pseudobythopirellula maris]|uniref:cysteine desulfurase family protein n=1 Tax=Pseudobythopirellula maris TaxID=2527991 RepID=UPI0011B38A15|nr:cysteine desulfurase family protein [Pseudobythopirellula maris]